MLKCFAIRAWTICEAPGATEKTQGVCCRSLCRTLPSCRPSSHGCASAMRLAKQSFLIFICFPPWASYIDLRSDARRTDERYACLQRLAAALHVDEQGLVSEFEALQPVAMSFRRQQDCTSRGAWKQALKRSQASSALKQKYETKNLASLLRAHACWTTSSSGVEQAFSKAQRSQGAKHPFFALWFCPFLTI